MKIKKILFLILGSVALSAFYLVINYWEYVEQVSWDEDYDKRAKSYNAGALTDPLNFKYEEKEIYKGLDLSHHNKIIKYEGLSEYDFIYHKATEGSTFVDPKFKSRMVQILKMGIPFGGYHFFTTTASGKEQFENFKKVVHIGDES